MSSVESLQQARQRLDKLRALAGVPTCDVPQKRALSTDSLSSSADSLTGPPSKRRCDAPGDDTKKAPLRESTAQSASDLLSLKEENVSNKDGVSKEDAVSKEDTRESVSKEGTREKDAVKDCAFVSALRYVADHLDAFFPKDAAPSILAHVESVDLLYPAGIHETYLPVLLSILIPRFPLVPPLKEGYSPIMDLVKTVLLIAYDFPSDLGDPNDNLNDGLCKQIERAAKKKDYVLLKSLVAQFNAEIKLLMDHGRFNDPAYKKRPMTYDQSTILLDQIYARIVTDPDALRQYKGFSKEVYGETRHPVIHDIIQRIPMQSNQIFLDLGSGIGNVVFQVAAETGCRAYGVELLETPAHFARLQYTEYKARMTLLGRTDLGIIRLKQADFLEDPQVQRIIEKCDVIFVNNYAFEAKLNTNLMHHFLAMKDGAHIVSFVAFRPLEYTITEHNMNDMASILTVQKVGYSSGGVSWTASPGEFYIHRVDRRPLRKFMMERECAGTSRRSRRG